MLDRLQYRFLNWYTILADWVKTRFTPAGKFVLLGLVVSATLGWTPNKTLAFQVFTFLFFLLLISSLFSFFFHGRFKAARRLPRFVSVDQPVSYSCELENQSGEPQAGLSVMEDFKKKPPEFEHFIALKPPPGKKRGRVRELMDRDAVRAKSFLDHPARVKEQPLSTLIPQQAVTAEMTLTPLKRGYLRFRSLSISRPDPFGIYRGIINVPCEQSLLVLPKIYPTPPMQISGSRRYNQKGMALASNIGESEEFISLRDYRPGDPVRFIHWKSWAKTGDLVVKQYQDEFFSRYALILDTFVSADGPLFEEAVSVAASFSANIELGESLLDLMFVGTKAYCFTKGRSLGHTDQMLEVLASVKICESHPFSTLTKLVLNRSSILSGSICVFLKWDQDRQDLTAHLKSLDVPLRVFVITDEESDVRLDLGPMEDAPGDFHVLKVGHIKEGLMKL